MVLVMAVLVRGRKADFTSVTGRFMLSRSDIKLATYFTIRTERQRKKKIWKKRAGFKKKEVLVSWSRIPSEKVYTITALPVRRLGPHTLYLAFLV
jgi:hypothetical protein